MNRLLPACGALALLAPAAAAVENVATLPPATLPPATLPPAILPPATLPPYERVSGVSGNLSSTGSDTLANLMTLWTEAFKRHYPNVNIQVQAPGSSAAPTALTEGTSILGPMSRLMKDREVEAFETRRGYKPTAIRVAVDALAVYVNKDNPIRSMSLSDVDAVFSVSRRCGGGKDIRTWGDAGLTGAWASRPMQLYGRNSVSGTYGYFKQKALCSGDFRNTVNEQPGSASVVQAVTSSLNGIGYSGIGYRTSGVRAVPLARSGATAAYEASAANTLDRSYPLTRFLFVYVNNRPDSQLPPLETEFFKFVLSRDGQMIVQKDGYMPLTHRQVMGELRYLREGYR
ncbi:MAG: phosphate ABC transporter substrate-binding protein PstS family protein [Gammaproteobacteria bacterium]|nr:phosphate ABC transporter substrate-binding protein PstS family protein [Gammaproteobacteria bacterium]